MFNNIETLKTGYSHKKRNNKKKICKNTIIQDECTVAFTLDLDKNKEDASINQEQVKHIEAQNDQLNQNSIVQHEKIDNPENTITSNQELHGSKDQDNHQDHLKLKKKKTEDKSIENLLCSIETLKTYSSSSYKKRNNKKKSTKNTNIQEESIFLKESIDNTKIIQELNEEEDLFKNKEDLKEARVKKLLIEKEEKEVTRLKERERLKLEALLLNEARFKEEARLKELARIKEEARIKEQLRLKELARLKEEEKQKKQKFMKTFEIINKDLYLINKDHINCNICKDLVFNPKMCKDCGLIYCNICFTSKNTCINCPNNSSVVEPLISLKKIIDNVQLKCKAGCVIPLSEGYRHMITCLPLQMDVNCWNCNKKTFENSLKINQIKIENNIIFNGKERLHDENHIKLQDLYLKQSGSYYNLLNNVKEKKTLQEQIYEIEGNLKSKETYLAMIEKFKKVLMTGESIEQLKQRLDNNNSELSRKEVEIQKYYKDLKDLGNDISNENRRIKNSITLFEEKINTKNFLELEIKSKNFSNSLIQIKPQTINMEYVIDDIVILNKTQIALTQNKIIKIWDFLDGVCKASYSGHSYEIACLLKLNGNELASGSADCTIKIWDLIKGMCSKTLNGHSRYIRCIIKLNESQIASGSDDKTIKIWDFVFGSCLKSINGHSASVMCLMFLSESKIVSGSSDKSLMIWDHSIGSYLKTFGHSNEIRCLIKLSENQIASGSDSVKLWNLNGICLKTFSELDNYYRYNNYLIICIIKLNDNLILVGSDDRSVKIWDFLLGTCVKQINIGNTSFKCIIKLNENQVASGSESIQIWDI